MSDILSARAEPAAPPPPLTAHLRHHLVAQYRHDLRRAEADAERLRTQRDAYLGGSRQLRYVLARAAIIRADLAEMELRA